MSSKTNTEVLIGGKVYTLSGYESEDYLQKIATYISNKMSEFNKIDEYKRLPFDMKATLLQLNLADDFHKAKEKIDILEKDLHDRDNECYELKHELIALQIKHQEISKTLKELQEENKELQINKVRLESSLEEVLFKKKENEND